jgi:hypothetical protein
MLTMRPTLIQCTTILSVISTAVAQVSFTAYANDFVDPNYILAKDFGDNTEQAQASITAWASLLTVGGPWSECLLYSIHVVTALKFVHFTLGVMDKAVTPPSGNKHDYMSWAP